MTTLRGGMYPLFNDYKDSFSSQADGFRSLRESLTSLPRIGESSHRTLHYSTIRKNTARQVLPTRNLMENMIQSKQERMPLNSFWLPHRPKVDPIMSDKETGRKYEVGKHFVRKSAQPLWTSIKSINNEIRKFADKNERIFFFDATPIFTEKVDNSFALLTDRITVRGHPTEKGFAIWEDAIVAKLQDILNIEMIDRTDSFATNKNLTRSNDEKDMDIDAIINDVLPVDDDIDSVIFHTNDDAFGSIMTVDVDESDPSMSDDNRDGGDLFLSENGNI